MKHIQDKEAAMLFTAEETNKTMLDVLRGLFTVGGFNHKMPKEGKMTKTLETCIERINSFMNGTFERIGIWT